MKKLLVAILFLFCYSDVFAGDETEIVELEPIVITPWRIEESISDVSRNVTVITEKDIKASRAQYLPELIQDKTGVVVSDYFGNPKNAVVDIRGFGEASLSNVLVLIDGRRTNQVDLSGVDWAQIDLNAIEKIEVVRGPSAVLYGDNASASVINIITKKGITEKPTMTIASEVGSHQYHKAYGNLSGRVAHADYFFSYSNQSTTGYRANNDYWGNDYFGRFTLYPTNTSELNFTAGYHRDHYGMPGSLYLTDIERIGRKGSTHPDDRGFTSDYYLTAEPKLVFFFAGNQIAASVFSTFRERRAKNLSVSGSWQGETVHHITTYEIRPKLETSLQWKGIDNSLLVGVDYFHAKDQVLSGDRIDNQQAETDVYKETIGAYIHDNIKISDKFILNAGGRGEWADYTFNEKRLSPSHNTKKLKVGAFNFGGGYKYNENSQLYFDVSKSYRFPNTEEYYQSAYVFFGTVYPAVFNADMKHQQAINYEIGIKDITFDWLHFNADAFLMDVRSEIYYDPSTWKNTNYSPKTRHYGLELESQLNLLQGRLQPFINWTLQESFFKGGIYAGNQVPLVPKNKISTGITVSPIKDFDWTTSLNYVGSRFKVSDQKNIASKLKDYATVDTKLSYGFKHANIWGAIKNVFGKEYYPYGVTNGTGTAEVFYPAPERRFEAGATITF